MDRTLSRRGGTVRVGPGLSIVVLVAGVLAVYGLLRWLGLGPLGEVATAGWTARRIPTFYAPVTLAVAVVAPRLRAVAVSLAGFVVGVAVGELVGAQAHAAQRARLERELAAGIEQSWEPTHPGWWIATVVFLVCTVAGVVRSRRGVGDPSTVGRPGPGDPTT